MIHWEDLEPGETVAIQSLTNGHMLRGMYRGSDTRHRIFQIGEQLIYFEPLENGALEYEGQRYAIDGERRRRGARLDKMPRRGPWDTVA